MMPSKFGGSDLISVVGQDYTLSSFLLSTFGYLHSEDPTSFVTIRGASIGGTDGSMICDVQMELINCHINLKQLSLLEYSKVKGCTIKAEELIDCADEKEPEFSDCALDFPGFNKV